MNKELSVATTSEHKVVCVCVCLYKVAAIIHQETRDKTL
jgi:hypothetical protein